MPPLRWKRILGLRRTPPEVRVAEGQGLDDVVRHMEWWDTVSYDDLVFWTPTAGAVPKGCLHSVARLKGSILSRGLAAKRVGDIQFWGRTWKAITFIDRLLFAQAP